MAMMIEDEELRNIYKSASNDHVDKIEAGLLQMEKDPTDISPLEELLREAHSLKGDSRMLGVKDVETLIHQIEHIFGTIKKGEAEITQVLCDRLWTGLDAIRKLIHSAVTGEEVGVNTFAELAQLMGATPPANKEEKPVVVEAVKPIETPQKTAEVETVKPAEILKPVAVQINNIEEKPAEIIEKIPETKVTHPVKNIAPIPQNNSYKIETIRVETKHLDTLMTQAGELTVTKIRIAHRLTEIEEILTLWEDTTKDGLNKNNGTKNSSLINQERVREKVDKLGGLIGDLRNSIYEDTARLDTISTELEEGIRTLRLLPLSTIFQLYPRMVRDLAKQQGKEINLIIEGGETTADKRILEEMKDPLMHMIRNSIDHGIETPEERAKLGKPPTATLKLKGYQTATNIIIEVLDDGRGLDLQKIKQVAIKKGLSRPEELEIMTENQIYNLIFTSGFSTRTVVTEVSGRGVGLDIVRTNVEKLKGTIQVESQLQKGSIFRIHLGITLATAHVLIVEVDRRIYALPVEFVQTTLLIPTQDIFSIEGRDTILWNNQPVSVVKLADVLELPPLEIDSNLHDSKPCIIIQIGSEKLGIFVDALIDEQDVMLKPQSKLLKRVRNISGATILGTGEVCMVLNPTDLMKTVRRSGASVSVNIPLTSNKIAEEIIVPTVSENKKSVILLVEDSIATRTQEKRILESAGYEVITAVDGLDGWNKLKTREFDAVISDIQMPNLDGLNLTARIREQKEYNELPIILVTSLASDEDKRKGAEAGANAYITKGTFNQEVLVDTLRRLI